MTIDDRLRESGRELRAVAQTIDLQPITFQPIGTGGRRRRGLVYAVATAAVVLVLIGSAVWLTGLGVETRSPGSQPTIPVTTVPSTITSPATTVPLLTDASRSAVMTLSAAPGVDPVRVSTVLGDVEFTTLQFPPGLEFYPVAVTPHGPVAVGDAGLWWSNDYLAWHSVPITVDPARMDFPKLIVVGDDVVINGGFTAVRFGWDGSGWAELGRQGFPYRMSEIAYGPHGAVALAWGEEEETGVVSNNGTPEMEWVFNGAMFSSSDGVHFTRVEHPPGKDVFVTAEDVSDDDREFLDCRQTAFATVGKIDTVLATDEGFVALTSASHPLGTMCDPLVWFSPDGHTWELESRDSPFGNMAIVYGVEERAGQFVATGAVGGQGKTEEQYAAWLTNDGLTWQLIDIPGSPGAVIGGEMGWMALGGGPQRVTMWFSVGPAMWFSADGLTWDGPYQAPEGLLSQPYREAQIAVGSDSIFAVGVDANALVPVVGRLQE